MPVEQAVATGTTNRKERRRQAAKLKAKPSRACPCCEAREPFDETGTLRRSAQEPQRNRT